MSVRGRCSSQTLSCASTAKLEASPSFHFGGIALTFHASFKQQLGNNTEDASRTRVSSRKENIPKEAAVGLAFKAELEKELGIPIKQGMEVESLRLAAALLGNYELLEKRRIRQ